MEGSYFNIRKPISDQPIANISLMGRTESISPKTRNRTRVSAPHCTYLSTELESLAREIRQQKKKGIQVGNHTLLVSR
jgi:hypothetical protein